MLIVDAFRLIQNQVSLQGFSTFYISHVSKLEQWQEQGYFFQYINVYFFIHELFPYHKFSV